MPQPVRKVSPAQWVEARRLHAGGMPFKALAARLGIGVAYLRSRARTEGWASLPDSATRGAYQRRSPASPATAETRRRLAVRLYSVIEFRIRMMELRMQKQLLDYQTAGTAAEPPPVSKDERDSFAALIDSINQVTEMASDPASAADGRRKSASINPELAALSDDLDPDAVAAASEKDAERARLAQELAKFIGPA